MQLRRYQRRAAGEIVATCKARRATHTLYVAPTGSGKTVIAAAAIKQLVAVNKRVLFVAHTKEILLQTRKQLEAGGLRGKRVAVVAASVGSAFEDAAAPVQVCSVQTLAARNLWPAADVVFIDEAHHGVASRYARLLAAYPRARIIGLTATPYRLDGQRLDAVFDKLVAVAKPEELVAAGYLAAATLYGAPPEAEQAIKAALKNLNSSKGDYAQRELGVQMRKPELVGNIVKEWQRLCAGRKTVVFASSVEHSKALAARFVKARVKAAHIDGSMSQPDRDSVLADLSAGRVTVVTNCNVLMEGWDQPDVKCVVLARPTKSRAVYMQQAGRCLRPWEDKQPIILDHAGNHTRFGFPDADVEWSLTEAKKAVGAAVNKTCPDCLHSIPAGLLECPHCGCAFEIERSDRDLAETEAKLQELQRTEEWKQRVLAFARKRKLGAAWAAKVVQGA